MQGLQDGTILQDLVFSLFAYNADGEVVQHRYRGGWLLVDNGYLACSTTVPPFKTTYSRAEIRFSTWLESLRKDVECTFGILKGRWRILKCGIRIHGTDGPDQVFLTCCALHNKLLDIDGLDERWEQGVQSIWSTTYDNDDGDNDDDMLDGNAVNEVDVPCIVPDAILRLQNPALERQYGVSNERLECDHNRLQQTPAPAVVDAATTVDTTTDDDIVEVRKLSLTEFRRRLVVHFSIALERNEVQWPQRFVVNRNKVDDVMIKITWSVIDIVEDNLYSTLLSSNGAGEGNSNLVSTSTSLLELLVAFVRMLVIVASIIVSMFPTVDASASSLLMICSSANVSSSIAAANSRFSLRSSNRKTWPCGSLWAVASIKYFVSWIKDCFPATFFRCIAILRSLTFVFFFLLSAIRD